MRNCGVGLLTPKELIYEVVTDNKYGIAVRDVPRESFFRASWCHFYPEHPSQHEVCAGTRALGSEHITSREVRVDATSGCGRYVVALWIATVGWWMCIVLTGTVDDEPLQGNRMSAASPTA